MSTTTTTAVTLTHAGDFDSWMADLINVREKTAAAREEMLAASALAVSASLDKLTPPPTPIQEASIETTIPTLPHLEKPIPPRPDLNFKSPYFEIRASGKLNGGMGAFATRDIPVMTTILRENYLVEATDRPGHLLEELEKCTEEEKNAFFKLASYDRLSQNWAQAIFLTNRFATFPAANTAIFLTASRFNHSCEPCIFYQYDTTLSQLVFITTQRIKKGEEMTIRYNPDTVEVAKNYGFLCDCGFCKPPKEIPEPI